MTIAEIMEIALGLHQRGELDQAESVYRKVLRHQPRHADALHLLGVIAFQRGLFESAEDLIRRALGNNPEVAIFHNNLGNVYWARKNLKEAQVCYRKALHLDAGYAEAHNNLGNVLMELGRPGEAVGCYKNSLRLEPGAATVHNNLGLALAATGRHDEAVAFYEEALRLQPGYPDACNNLGNAHKACNRLPEAIAFYKRALELDPRFEKAYHNAGTALYQLGRLDEAAENFRRALDCKPDSVDTCLSLAHALREQGDTAAAQMQFRQALELAPESVAVRWGNCLSEVPLLYDSPGELHDFRNRYGEKLRVFSSWVDSLGDDEIAKASDVVGSCQPFFLAYQGECDRDLQSVYGSTMCRIQAAKSPAWRLAPRMTARKSGERIRVGILSGYFYLHSNWKIPIRGWVENLDRNRFELYGYSTGQRRDSETDVARGFFSSFVEGLASSGTLCEVIRKDRLHALIIPEIGMDAQTVRCASHRLSPVQCASWGHPDTSGLPSIDYYLSSDLMEPPDGEQHYTEQLVRLPNLSICYTPPDLAPAPLTREELGLRTDAAVFFCAQSLFKYLPQYDDLLVRIAASVRDCQFAFLEYPKSRVLAGNFRARLLRAFERGGLRGEDYLRFLPHLDPNRYQGLNRIVDVFLDSIEWSGCNSSLEAIRYDVPMVTFPGRFMRGRHTAAFLTMMGLGHRICATLEEYVRTAAELARDEAKRRCYAAEIAARRHKLYRDMECIRGLERFLEQTCR
jgi:protein O-GlcNAc transferase